MARSAAPPAPSLPAHRGFRMFWAADTVSQFGTYVGNTVLPLAAATTLAASPWEMGVLGAAETAGYLLIGLPAGVWVERARQRRLMMWSNAVRALLLCTVAVAWWLGVLTVSQLVAVALLAGVCAVLFDVSYQSYLPSLVAREHLVEGNAKLQSSQSLAQITGPGIGGGLVQLSGVAGPVLGTAGGYLLAAVLLRGVPESEPAPRAAGGASVLAEIREGLRFVARTSALRAITCCTATANLFSGVLNAVLVLFLTRTLALSGTLVGLVLSVLGLGGVLAALTARPVIRRLGQARAVWLVPVTAFPALFLVPLARPGPLVAAAVLGLLVTGYGTVLYNIAQVSYRQAACPERMLARVNATVRFVAFGTLTLGTLAGGALGGVLGVRGTLWIAAAGTCLAGLWVLCSPLRGMDDFVPEQG
ncbi:MFS transporter [Streptomyces sp. V2]|uniref:MFS transporter n=1 Tax=Streptomyces sp. V2 TaxID=1424099 RepID=UPI001F0BFE23|nr:MFS transporter [Streptomyces sp. V2]